jgi:hypothetical protein
LAAASFAGSELPSPATSTVLRSNGSDHRDSPHSGHTQLCAAYIAPTTTLSKLLKTADAENRWDLVSAKVPSKGSIGGAPWSDSNVIAREPEACFRVSESVAELADAFASPHGRRDKSPDTASIGSISVPGTPPAAPVQKDLMPRFSRSRRVGLSQAVRPCLSSHSTPCRLPERPWLA